MDCLTCTEDIDSTNSVRNIFIDKETGKERIVESFYCNVCTKKIINETLPRIANSIYNENCEASLKRLMSQPLPTNMTADGTGRGTIVDKMVIDGEVKPTLLNTEIFKGEIDHVNEQMKIIHEMMDDSDYSYLDDIRLLFKKYI